jgi:hypothetical protein
LYQILIEIGQLVLKKMFKISGWIEPTFVKIGSAVLEKKVEKVKD